jgi:hypothetical protein
MSGQPHDIEMAAYVSDFIQGSIRSQWDQARKRHGFPGREFLQFALGVVNGFYTKLENDRRALSERIHFERRVAEAALHTKRGYVCTDLIHVSDPKLSDYVKQRYGKLRSIGRPMRARKSSYYAGKKVGETLVLHRGIDAAPSSSGLMLPE